MASGPFEILLEDLSKVLKIKDLHPDRNNSCLIKFPDGVSVQLEVDKTGELIILGVSLGEPEVGRYRENLFREALRCNGAPHPRVGTFAYSQKSNQLLIWEQLPLKDITAEKVGSLLTPLMEKAAIWKEALSRVEVPTIYSTGGSSMGMFGLRP